MEDYVLQRKRGAYSQLVCQRPRVPTLVPHSALLCPQQDERNYHEPRGTRKLQAQVGIGGNGTARREKKVVPRTARADDKKLQSSFRKLGIHISLV